MSATGDLPPCPEFIAACERGDVFQRKPRPLGPDGFTPLAPASTCSTCGCGVAGDGDCPCGCVEAAERTREAFALGAAWALGDDEEAPAALRARIEQVSAERDRYRTAWKSAVTRAGLAADRAESAEAEVERLLDVLAEVRRVFDLQCPPMSADRYVDRGAWMAHSWWNTVLGGILSEMRPLPIHRTEAGYPSCSTCDGGGCYDCTDPA